MRQVRHDSRTDRRIPWGSGMDLLRIVGRRRSEAPEAAQPATGLIMVPVSGHPVDEQVIRLAGVMSRRQKTNVLLIRIVEVPRSLPIDSDFDAEHSQAVLDTALRQAGLQGFQPETSMIQARDAGAAIVDESLALKADLILLGLPRLMVSGQPSLGKTVPYVLLRAQCRVIVVRP